MAAVKIQVLWFVKPSSQLSLSLPLSLVMQTYSFHSLLRLIFIGVTFSAGRGIQMFDFIKLATKSNK